MTEQNKWVLFSEKHQKHKSKCSYRWQKCNVHRNSTGKPRACAQPTSAWQAHFQKHTNLYLIKNPSHQQKSAHVCWCVICKSVNEAENCASSLPGNHVGSAPTESLLRVPSDFLGVSFPLSEQQKKSITRSNTAIASAMLRGRFIQLHNR